jgi:hypothetical protein
MNIQSVRPEIVVGAANSKPGTKSVDNDTQTPGTVSDSYLPEQNEDLLEALRNQPNVRPEVLERAKQLVADSGYPPKDVIESIADTFLTSAGK